MAPILRREIPPLRLLCLRSIGPPSCNPEITFASPSSRNDNDNVDADADADDDDDDDDDGATIDAATTNNEDDTCSQTSSSSVNEVSQDESSIAEEGGAGAVNDDKQENLSIDNKESEKEDANTFKEPEIRNLSSPKDSFPTEESMASKLLRALSRQPTYIPHHEDKKSKADKKNNNKNNDTNTNTNDKAVVVYNDISDVPIPRLEYGSGPKGNRRSANDVDISSPWIAVSYQYNKNDDSDYEEKDDEYQDYDKRKTLIMEHGNPGMDCLQSYIDSLVELGRMSDNRLGKQFFLEWKKCVLAGSQSNVKGEDNEDDNDYEPKSKKHKKNHHSRKKKQKQSKSKQKQKQTTPKGSLSLFNCASASRQTFQAMHDARIGKYLNNLDLTGVHSLTDVLFTEYVVPSCPRLQRLSLKNCRRITGVSVKSVAKGLKQIQAIDVGGSFNVTPHDVIELAQNTRHLSECYASGLEWTDILLHTLMEAFKQNPHRPKLIGLAIGFSPMVTGPGLLQALEIYSPTLRRLGLHFCDTCMDSNHMLAELGRLLPDLNVLDIRGCNGINSITPFMNARAGRDEDDIEDNKEEQSEDEDDVSKEVEHRKHTTLSTTISDDEGKKIFILARYSNISQKSLDVTNSMYPGLFECIIDGGGTGGGIRR